VKKPAPFLILLLLASSVFTLATLFQPRAVQWGRAGQSGGVLKLLLGDGRRIFANHFFVKADVAFHSGYYPTIFDQQQAPKDSRHLTAEEGSAVDEEHDRAMHFLGPPRDWIERFGRHFFITEHTHLKGGREREILPWLRLSAELDPQRVDTYTVAAYWLGRLGKPAEAQQFLRDGLRANPNSYEILFELGRQYYEAGHDAARARNLWELALRRWREQESGKKDPDKIALDQITVRLANLEADQGNLERAIDYLEQARKVSPASESIQQQIDGLKQKAARRPGAGG
jgi:tetratricopeptide (TPR) repeat protein